MTYRRHDLSAKFCGTACRFFSQVFANVAPPDFFCTDPVYVSQDITRWHGNCPSQSFMNTTKLLMVTSFFTLTSWVSSLNASSSIEELCEKLHADHLNRAQKALSEDKREDALRLLLNALAIIQKCANSPEQPLPQKQAHETGLAFARHLYRAS
jgi:hypothetical protein